MSGVFLRPREPVIPSGRLPSVWDIPFGSLVTGILAETNERAIGPKFLALALKWFSSTVACKFSAEDNKHYNVSYAQSSNSAVKLCNRNWHWPMLHVLRGSSG